MAKDPAFLFYPGDWLGGTIGMSFEQKGCYMELLILQFNAGTFTESQVKEVLSIRFDYAWPTLKRKFKTDGTYYWNERLQQEKDKRLNFIESRRLSGSSPKKTKAYAKHTHKRTENENRNEINIGFEDFWDLYAKKVDRQKCEGKWIGLTDEERKNCIEKLPAYIQSTPDKKFRRDPETYLNNKSWENEIISPFPSKIPEQPLTYEEMCNRTTNDPEIWKRYKAVKREGERKAVFYPIKTI